MIKERKNMTETHRKLEQEETEKILKQVEKIEPFKDDTCCKTDTKKK